LGLAINKENKTTLANLCLKGIFGSVYLSFVALTLNFVFPLGKNLNTMLIILIFFFATYKKIDNYKNIILLSILSGCVSFIILNLENIYRPDAGLYHIPYIATLNDNKIILGLANIHFRFGHTSIIQYLSAIYNNHIFGNNGIVLPIATIFSFIFLYLLFEIKNNLKSNFIYTIFLLLIFIYTVLGYSRYTEFGNDVTAHLFSFLILSLFLKNFKNKENNINLINKLFLLSIFSIMQKISMICLIIIPAYCFFYLKPKIKILNFHNLFVTLFFLFFIFKNILVSGCMLYPISITCFDKLPWYSSNKDSISAKIQGLDNHAWAKGWPDLKDKSIGQENFINNFNWLPTWSKNHGLKVLQKLSIFFIFIFLFFYFLKFKPKILNNQKNLILEYTKNNIILLLCVSLFGTIIWFLRFPTFRYGSSYLVSTIILFSIFIFFTIKSKKLLIVNLEKITNYFLIFFITIFLAKNLTRFIGRANLDYYNYPWPKIYSEHSSNLKINPEPIFINGKLAYYFAKQECHYTLSPCTHLKVDNLDYYEKNNYKIFLLKN